MVREEDTHGYIILEFERFIELISNNMQLHFIAYMLDYLWVIGSDKSVPFFTRQDHTVFCLLQAPPLIKAPPLVWGTQYFAEGLK